MNIYPSEKVLPYVYICTHKITKEFYIGSRYSKKLRLPSHLDIIKYKTSSKIVKPKFEEYDIKIVAEFFNGDDAYSFEHSLIWENWNNPLLLNKSCYHEKRSFKCTSSMQTEESIHKWRSSRSQWSDERRLQWKTLMIDIIKNFNKNLSPEEKHRRSTKISETQINRSAEEKDIISNKISNTLKEYNKSLSFEEKSTHYNNRIEGMKRRKESGLKKKTPEPILCVSCNTLISPSWYSRHYRKCSNRSLHSTSDN